MFRTDPGTDPFTFTLRAFWQLVRFVSFVVSVFRILTPEFACTPPVQAKTRAPHLCWKSSRRLKSKLFSDYDFSLAQAIREPAPRFEI
jgi:hypothetical protein